MSDNNSSNLRPSLLRFFSMPAVGIAGLIVSIIGIVLSLYFFLAAREKAELTYFVHPAKAAVVRTGQASRFSVYYNGQNLTSNITAAQIAFWNAGSKPIHADTILSPLVIKVGNKGRILEAKLRKTSRDVVQITLNPARLSSGEIEINWNILEQNDGGVLQIVYIGDETVSIQAHAVLEGQPKIIEAKYELDLRTPSEEYAHALRTVIWSQLLYYLVIVIGALITLLSIWLYIKIRKDVERLRPLIWLILFLPGPMLIFGGILSLLKQNPPAPPFGF